MTLALFLCQTQNIAPAQSSRMIRAPINEGIRLEDESVVTGIPLDPLFTKVGIITSIYFSIDEFELGSSGFGKILR